jgi:hypothetical protein
VIQITADVDRGFAAWPFYVIPKWCVDTPREQPYIEHERTHCQRQKWLTPLWWVMWYFFTSFRRSEELLAYKAEIEKCVELNQLVDVHYYASEMTLGYNHMIAYSVAYDLVREWVRKAGQ